MIHKVLSIAGTDPTAGAGVQADLKTFSAFGAYGCTVLTALVAQNTMGVQAIHSLPADFVTAQLESVFADLPIAAAKTGMLERAAIIEAVAAFFERHPEVTLVVDPVMVAKGGDRLLAPDAVAALRDRLLPLARLITPNLPEAADLLGRSEAEAASDPLRTARDLLALGPRAVLLKGGHMSGPESVDILLDGTLTRSFTAPRLGTRNTHGTGCTLSAGITALLPRGGKLEDAVAESKAYLTEALRQADRLEVGHGHGPVHHFHAWW